MKLRTLILITLISFILCKSVDKDIKENLSNKDSKSSSKVEKKLRTGNMKDGFILPGFYITNLNNIKSEKVETFISPNTKFIAKQVEEPSNEYENIGIVFSFENFDERLSNVMLRIKNSNDYYIPYRYIKSSPVFRDSWLFWKNKSIEFILTNDNNDSFIFDIVFPYKLFGNYIENSDGIKLASKIGERKEEIISSLKKSLIELRKRSNTAKQKTDLIKDLTNDITSIEKRKGDLSEQLKKLTENSAFIKSEILKNAKLIDQVKMQLLTLEQNNESLNSQFTSNELEIKSNKELFDSLSINNKQDIISEHKDLLIKEHDELKNVITNLTTSLPEKKFILQNMNMNIKKEALSKIVEDFLLKITPRIDVTKVKK